MPKKIKKKQRQVSCQVWPDTDKVILKAQKAYKERHQVQISKCAIHDKIVRMGYYSMLDSF